MNLDQFWLTARENQARFVPPEVLAFGRVCDDAEAVDGVD